MWIGDLVISNLGDVIGSPFLYLSDPPTFDFFLCFFSSFVVGDGHFSLILCWIEFFRSLGSQLLLVSFFSFFFSLLFWFLFFFGSRRVICVWYGVLPKLCYVRNLI